MHNERFDAIAAELERLTIEIAAINRQPFDTRIDLRSVAENDDEKDDMPPMPINDWRLHR